MSTHAIVRRIPNSFKTLALGISDEIDLEKAKTQHEEYCKALRNVGLKVIELPEDENLPDSVFVEDTAVICNGTALICRPGHPTRQKEVEMIRTVIKKELELPILEISDPEATIDGGDVLFTGREFLVGLSSRTNEAGSRALAAAFPEYPVTPIRIKHKLHLKTSLTMAGPDTLCVSEEQESQDILKKIEQEASFQYKTITVPDGDAANCIYVNGTLIHLSEFPNSTKVFEEKVDFNRIALNISEFRKADGSLTCPSIVIKKTK
ncbi:LOW QUALITY PROTEIN: N(G),N(G)-dimethylarginine dimethylaminohydrolase 1-like [Limulus polyphemus]|uniref:LOW QUALITY PROTEIN: N(G),N(G)-dimethylarginine dimethylaminohydrolase 1-like n=1 Tax=Limulus polyphemus TaxID=6850 RepID=A0ABM1BKY3_LIMPO|nr:LOW QUALITY PROTEIN: N(G),N(G)-dimethylarginine dimethylaminohydrolase 1-like [Limulus polyphemus]